MAACDRRTMAAFRLSARVKGRHVRPRRSRVCVAAPLLYIIKNDKSLVGSYHSQGVPKHRLTPEHRNSTQRYSRSVLR